MCLRADKMNFYRCVLCDGGGVVRRTDCEKAKFLASFVPPGDKMS